jgi:hypothetical protein
MKKPKSPATKAPSPEAPRPTIREIVAFMHKRATARRDAWIAMVNEATIRALEWSREGVEAAIVVETCDHALRALDNEADLEKHARAQAFRYGAFPPASTGLLDAEINAYRVAAWIRIADEARNANP